MPEKEAGGDTMNLLQKLERDEILEVLSEEGVFCKHCESLLQSRILNLLTRKVSEVSLSRENTESSEEFWSASANASSLSLSENDLESSTIISNRQESASWSSSRTPESVYSARRKDYAANLSPASSVTSKRHSLNHSGSETLPNGGPRGVSSVVGTDCISQDEKERVLLSQVGRKKDFVHIERVNEKPTNVLQGLELHTRVFNAEEQKNIVECVYNLQRMGQKGQLRVRTYSEPSKWMRGKGRVTMQFGCCYNYAVDKKGNPPGIIRDEEVDPLPPLFKQMIKRMVRWHVLPSTCVPNSCIVNIYDEGDCIPPHVDHHDFLRPFCTVSFLTECKILFGSTLKIVGPGEFSGPVSIPLPVGSVLVLSGNGANIAKHSVPAVPTKRISITFRKMDDSKLPYKFSPDPELLGIKPLAYSSTTKSPVQRTQHQQIQHQNKDHNNGVVNKISDNSFVVAKDDFPPLGSSTSGSQRVNNRIGFKR